MNIKKENPISTWKLMHPEKVKANFFLPDNPSFIITCKSNNLHPATKSTAIFAAHSRFISCMEGKPIVPQTLRKWNSTV